MEIVNVNLDGYNLAHNVLKDVVLINIGMVKHALVRKVMLRVEEFVDHAQVVL